METINIVTDFVQDNTFAFFAIYGISMSFYHSVKILISCVPKLNEVFDYILEHVDVSKDKNLRRNVHVNLDFSGSDSEYSDYNSGNDNLEDDEPEMEYNMLRYRKRQRKSI